MPNASDKPTESPTSIATDIINLLTSSDATVSVAESLTGGAIMSTLTSLPGVGSVFHGGLVAYDTPLKTKHLKVDESLVEREGVIHPDVAAQMAKGVREMMRYDGGIAEKGTRWGLATTGVAGPGKQDGKDMGTVYIGVAGPGMEEGKGFGPFWLPGTRERVIEGAVGEALKVLREFGEHSPKACGKTTKKPRPGPWSRKLGMISPQRPGSGKNGRFAPWKTRSARVNAAGSAAMVTMTASSLMDPFSVVTMSNGSENSRKTV
ncbi:competence-damaged protein-domain-containing protein [Podospora aff. communis PSN243]|uniref:Competence-damaged protein-domain-containing protein n=1 Tax=Podospora aff. communis PSN243 TaxID=3040156 RepID=A0AAV9G3B2_9PEZI|nr:competence-damaged protein-domain-containing protein [Podospora aff. communis PSN243]